MRSHSAFLLLTCLLLAAGCSSDDDDAAPGGNSDPLDGSGAADASTSDDTATDDDASDSSTPTEDTAADTDEGSGDPDVLVGAFQIQLIPASDGSGSIPAVEGHTTVYGKVFNGPTPETIEWEAQSTDGDCTLYTPHVPYCETPCGGAAACVADNTCQAYPRSQGLGTVTLAGVTTADGATSFDMTPISNGYQPPASVSLPFDAFAAGDRIAIQTSGGDTVAPFSVETRGIEPLSLTSTDFQLDGSRPITVAWTAGAEPSARISVKLDISHHGGSKGKILCDTADDGELVIGSELAGALRDLGVSGFPTIVVSRSATGSTAIRAGRVDLVTSSILEVPVTVPGLVSCNSDDDCPDGLTCQTDLSCQ